MKISVYTIKESTRNGSHFSWGEGFNYWQEVQTKYKVYVEDEESLTYEQCKTIAKYCCFVKTETDDTGLYKAPDFRDETFDKIMTDQLLLELGDGFIATENVEDLMPMHVELHEQISKQIFPSSLASLKVGPRIIGKIDLSKIPKK